jgi:2-(1,2-epoxy-1,2-dihydrophenyl)acetyl-CoA isomerase
LTYKHILVEKHEHTSIIKLNRPEIRNALLLDMRLELYKALEELEEDNAIKSIILTGEGSAFSAGGDLASLKEIKLTEGRKRLQIGHKLITKMLDIEKPIIAAVNGPATGAGFNLALVCDMIIASEKAFFIQSFVNVGLVPDFGGIHFLPYQIGLYRAKELMFTGEKIDAEKAYEYGIINKLVKADDLLDESIFLATKLSVKSPISIGFTKKMMNRHLHSSLSNLLELEATAQDVCFQTEDFKEGANAFFEKRKPQFKGR